MDEICFRYPRRTDANGVADGIRLLHPGQPSARVVLRDEGAVVHVPLQVWDRRLVPEFVLGLGGRLTACDATSLNPLAESDVDDE